MTAAPVAPTPVPAPAHSRVDVLGCPVDALDMDQTVARCTQLIDAGGFHQHVAINAAKLVAMRDDPQLREIIERCDVISADGQSVVWASRLLHAPLPERVAGIDLMDRLLAEAVRSGYGVFILGARNEVLEEAVRRIRVKHEGIDIAGFRDGYFADDEAAGVCAQIRDSGASILLVAMSSPKKELFLGEFGPKLGVPFVMGVGGAIDVTAGITRRAPAAWQSLGLEWLYRLLQEPRRMFRRYAVTNTQFLVMLARAVARRQSPK
ncbi:N-acetylglucosaminyldiphosphoundecaprenol N-acetyl-beta-D-mannosaminyltransferase [Baekduia alba]|uniref:WecB/TagA/CpsF family glycosyltransferase n=1 Tax=Baekduia alba TaxID=2997333 RepID=UPI0023421D6E|nr:WecB/TagA/CpsF family glycosyltransferase [Baekduia alba]WCB95808.1 N-acetylglucosaminyldiphosphoundecaprenol N-acetyl-beta-D-mannosaminyltransferase [Baekduia alba]